MKLRGTVGIKFVSMNPMTHHSQSSFFLTFSISSSSFIPKDAGDPINSHMPHRMGVDKILGVNPRLVVLVHDDKWLDDDVDDHICPCGLSRRIRSFGVRSEPNDMTSIIQKENETCKIYVRGYDQDGRALLYMRPAMENTKDAVNNVRHVVWNLEKAIACSSKQGRSKICIVIDYEGFFPASCSTSRYILDILQNHYPERMHKAYICNPPFVFR